MAPAQQGNVRYDIAPIQSASPLLANELSTSARDRSKEGEIDGIVLTRSDRAFVLEHKR